MFFEDIMYNLLSDISMSFSTHSFFNFIYMLQNLYTLWFYGMASSNLYFFSSFIDSNLLFEPMLFMGELILGTIIILTVVTFGTYLGDKISPDDWCVICGLPKFPNRSGKMCKCSSPERRLWNFIKWQISDSMLGTLIPILLPYFKFSILVAYFALSFLVTYYIAVDIYWFIIDVSVFFDTVVSAILLVRFILILG